MALIDDLIALSVGDAVVRDIRVGVHWTAVLGERCGLASTVLPGPEGHDQPPVPDAGCLTGQSVRSLLRRIGSHSPLERGIAVAALNALLPVEEDRCEELNAADLLVNMGRGRRVALVGHFPFVPRLRQAAGHLSVLELRPQVGDLPSSAAQDVIPEADVVAISGSALVNGTIEQLLALCHPDSFVVVLGPSTPLSPVWFEHGVTAVSGTVVVEPELVLRCASQGATFRQMRGVRLLTMRRS